MNEYWLNYYCYEQKQDNNDTISEDDDIEMYESDYTLLSEIEPITIERED